MITLRIIFIGLITFVPRDDGTLTALVMDGRNHVHSTVDASCIEPHIPTLGWEAKRCEGDCDNLPVRFERCPGEEPLEIGQGNMTDPFWVLDREHLTIAGSGGEYVAFDPNFIAPVMDASGNGYGQIAPYWLSEPTPGSGYAASMHLAKGRFGACHLASRDDAVHMLRFSGKGLVKKSYHGPMADIAMAELEVPGKFIEVTAAALDSSNSRTLRLYPETHRGKPYVTLVVSNQPPETERTMTGMHFEHYYHLLENPPQPGDAWVPVACEDGADCFAAHQDPWLPACQSQTHLPTANLLQRILAGEADFAPSGLSQDSARPKGIRNRPICPVSSLSE